MCMDDRTVSTNWYGTVCGTHFWYEILFNAVRGFCIKFRTMYRKSYQIKSVPKSVLVRIKVRISEAKKLKNDDFESDFENV